MIATYTEPKLTPVSRERAFRAMSWALGKDDVPDKVVALALAQCALETGRWKACHNFNVGNIKAGPKYEGQYTAFSCNEVLNGKTRWFSPEGETDGEDHLIGFGYDVPPGHPQTRFRAYANIYDGTLDYVSVLQARFSGAWPALEQGAAFEFVMALKMQGYFTADVAPYLRAVESLQREFLSVASAVPDIPEEPVDEELQRLLVLAQPIDLEGTGYDGRPTPEDWEDTTQPDSGERQA